MPFFDFRDTSIFPGDSNIKNRLAVAFMDLRAVKRGLKEIADLLAKAAETLPFGDDYTFELELASHHASVSLVHLFKARGALARLGGVDPTVPTEVEPELSPAEERALGRLQERQVIAGLLRLCIDRNGEPTLLTRGSDSDPIIDVLYDLVEKVRQVERERLARTR